VSTSWYASSHLRGGRLIINFATRFQFVCDAFGATKMSLVEWLSFSSFYYGGRKFFGLPLNRRFPICTISLDRLVMFFNDYEKAINELWDRDIFVICMYYIHINVYTCNVYICIRSVLYIWLIRKETHIGERNSFLLQFVSVTCNAYKFTRYVKRVFYLAISFKRELSL